MYSINITSEISYNDKGAIDLLTHIPNRVRTSSHYFDTLQVIQQIRKTSPIKFDWYWIKGHLDLDHTTDEIMLEENMNVSIVDSMAQIFNKEYRLNYYHIMQKDEWNEYCNFQVISRDQHTNILV